MSTLSSFRPFASRSAAKHFERAIFASVHAAASGDVHRGGPAGVAAVLWPDDFRAAGLLLRGAVSPTDTSAAATLAVTAVADFIASLTPNSAAARLIGAGQTASLDGIKTLGYPRRQGGKPAASVAWVREGGAIPVKQSLLEVVQLGPVKKLAVISAITHEIAERASGESTVSTLLREDCAASLDAGMFNNLAATADSPAGLLYGVASDHIITAASSGSNTERMTSDLEAIAGAIADSGGSDVVYIAAVRQANAARLRLGSTRATVWPSLALPAGTVVGVEAAAFVSAFGAIPRIQASTETLLQMDDTPGALSAVGTPNTVAAPIRSTFQTDTIALKCVLDAAWVMRAPGRVAYTTGATWGAPPTP